MTAKRVTPLDLRRRVTTLFGAVVTVVLLVLQAAGPLAHLGADHSGCVSSCSPKGGEPDLALQFASSNEDSTCSLCQSMFQLWRAAPLGSPAFVEVSDVRFVRIDSPARVVIFHEGYDSASPRAPPRLA